jgi:hypothetical protein
MDARGTGPPGCAQHATPRLRSGTVRYAVFARLRVTQHRWAAVQSAPHRPLTHPRANTSSAPAGTAARISAATRWSWAGASAVDSGHRGS